MPLVFTPCHGAVEVQRECEDAKVLTIETTPALTAIITGMTLELSGNYQFLHTISDLVYFYAFGDRVGTLNLTGLCFAAKCAGLNKGGLLDAYQYYLDNRATKRGGKPITITISAGAGQSTTLTGFLTGMRLDVADSQMGTVGYWSMRFEVLPEAG